MLKAEVAAPDLLGIATDSPGSRRAAKGIACARHELSPIDAFLDRLHERWLGDDSGAVADYIPPLAPADPGWSGIAVATTDGHCYEVGDSRRGFTIQSISKPFTYGVALGDRGFEAVDAKVGVEPSGDAFDYGLPTTDESLRHSSDKADVSP